ncbi:MAG: hypothetical protein FJX71_07025, partial [Alphaproteobacteria bacterium]|nr:hypothetical protein [Alphaproteobacteria bacterium]
MKIKLVLKLTVIALATLKGISAADDGGTLCELHAVLKQAGIVGFLPDEVEDTFLNVGLLTSELDHANKDRELLEAAHVQAAIILSLLEERLGGSTPPCPAERLEALRSALSVRATNLDEAVQNLKNALSEIPGADGSGAEIPGEDMLTKIKFLLEERTKEERTKRALKREISARAEEQAESNALVQDLITQITPISSPVPAPKALPQTSLPPLSSTCLGPVLSDYQRQLFSERPKIGTQAWNLLGGSNLSLATALYNAIMQNLNYTPTARSVDVFYIEPRHF